MTQLPLSFEPDYDDWLYDLLDEPQGYPQKTITEKSLEAGWVPCEICHTWHYDPRGLLPLLVNNGQPCPFIEKQSARMRKE